VTRRPSSERDAARAAKHHLREQLAGDSRVNGIGLTRWHDGYAVRVNVVDAADAPDLPKTVDGVPVRVVVVGQVAAQNESRDDAKPSSPG
jgi:hypothetical protein